MGARGPAPYPANVVTLRGNPSGRPVKGDAASSPSAEPLGDPPEYLPDIGKAEWLRVAGLLPGANSQDETALAAYCDSYARWREACRLLETEGTYLTTEKGYKYFHPAFSVRAKAQGEMTKAFSELGLSPMGRQRLRAPAAKQEPIGEGGAAELGAESNPYGAGRPGEFFGGTG